MWWTRIELLEALSALEGRGTLPKETAEACDALDRRVAETSQRNATNFLQIQKQHACNSASILEEFRADPGKTRGRDAKCRQKEAVNHSVAPNHHSYTMLH